TLPFQTGRGGRPMTRLVGGLLVLVSLAGSAAAQGGRLERGRDAVDSSDDKDSSKENRAKDHDSWSSSDSSDDSAAGSLFVDLFLAPFALPHLAMKDDFGRSGYFPRHPYAYDRTGYMEFELIKDNEPGRQRTWSGRVSVDEGNDFHGLNRTG